MPDKQQGFDKKIDIDLHNEVRWLIEDYIGDFDLKRELVDKIIEKVKEYNAR